jgi:GNAT superfamily N-acetyltransferase
MPTENITSLSVRNALEKDIPTLTTIKGDGSEAIHRDRLRDAQGPGFRYLVAVAEGTLVGLACLVYKRPAYWSDADDERCLPQIVDLLIEETCRSHGVGSAFVRQLENIAREAGSHKLYLAVDPIDNPRAHTFYLRLGYQPLQSAPYRKRWYFTDSQGNAHSGEDWVIDLVKDLQD